MERGTARHAPALELLVDKTDDEVSAIGGHQSFATCCTSEARTHLTTQVSDVFPVHRSDFIVRRGITPVADGHARGGCEFNSEHRYRCCLLSVLSRREKVAAYVV